MINVINGTVVLDEQLQANSTHFRKIVTHVVIVGTPVTGSADSVFHFRLSFVLVDGTAIRLDPRPAYNSLALPMRAYIKIEYKAYAWSRTAGTDAFITPVRGQPTCYQICKNLFETYKINQYEFDQYGRGCRHWCGTVVQCLAACAYLQDTAVDRTFVNWEISQYQKFGGRFPMPRIQGTFYQV
ncbi:hypothetical protein F5878DRAFT_543265 [Lentinula raphanica]|uniref:DUF7770 domain-containing protein n=1 Tax=Lentinula raphanica TaxID=153919 RepID=A0AA38UB33_9AGAR|nr:hypothetical protein F5878DRAFT_543265 [Lentinula raphanica]